MAGRRTVVLLPGGTFGPYAPLLFFPLFAALRRGAESRAVEWSDAERLRGLEPDAAGAAVAAQVEPVLAGLDPAGTLVVGKSLGTLAAPLVAEAGCPAVWLTPLLREPLVVEGLRRASAPFLLVGGTADPLWDGDVARELGPHVLELPAADHGLFVPGPLAGSAANVGTMVTAVEAFLDDVVWPATTEG